MPPLCRLPRLPATALLLLLALVLPQLSTGYCSFTQTCHSGMEDSKCHAVPYPHEPTPMTFSNPACPQYKESSCCTAQQNEYLTFNFFLIDSSFGVYAQNGCEACGQNLKDLYCALTCGPNQADYVHPIAVMNVSDPVNGGVITEVLKSHVYMEAKYACGLFDSCKNTASVRLEQAMSTCNGFLEYQGSDQAIGRGSDFSFVFTHDNATALSQPLRACNNYTMPGSPETKSCPCSVCAASCVSSSVEQSQAEIEAAAAISRTYGADWTAVGIVVSAVAGVSVLLVIWRIFVSHHS